MASNLRGRFIVLDGPDGAGKTTQVKRLAASLEAAGLDVVTCRDPGGTEIGDRIRGVLLDHDLTDMDPTCETLLFMASRAQLLGEVIRPALAAGRTVVCDRFVSATCAYQGAAGFDPARVIEVGEIAVAGNWPHLTIVIDVDVDAGFSRIERRNGDAEPDAMERRSLEFHRNVRSLFLKLPEFYPAPVVIVDGRGDVESVHQRILEALAHVAP